MMAWSIDWRESAAAGKTAFRAGSFGIVQSKTTVTPLGGATAGSSLSGADGCDPGAAVGAPVLAAAVPPAAAGEIVAESPAPEPPPHAASAPPAATAAERTVTANRARIVLLP